MKHDLGDPNCIAFKPVQDLTIRQCYELAADFHERYMWDTNNRRDLWTAAMLKYVASSAEQRCEDGEQFCQSLTIGDASSRQANRFAFIDENIFGMVSHFDSDSAGRSILDSIIKNVGLNDWEAR